MAAARAGNLDAVTLLLDRGAAVNAADPQYGHTALMWAVRRNDTAITRLLLTRGATIEAHTRVGEKPAVRLPGAGGGSHGVGIVRSGVPPQGEQQPTPGGMTPLLFAARDGLLDAAKLLVEGRRGRQRARSERHHAAADGAHQRADRGGQVPRSSTAPIRSAATGGAARPSGQRSTFATSPPAAARPSTRTVSIARPRSRSSRRCSIAART